VTNSNTTRLNRESIKREKIKREKIGPATISHPALGSSLERELWPPILQQAIREVFELMLAYSLEVPTIPPPEHGLDITAMVGLAGELCGILTVRCSTQTAARLAARMLGTDLETAGPEKWDAMGEICNLVAGNFKHNIPGLEDGCMLSPPMVISGAEYSLHAMIEDELHTVLLFEGEPLLVSLEIHR
jgi:chemotaxis protein CheX